MIVKTRKSELIEALLVYRQTALAAGRPWMAGWAGLTLAKLTATSQTEQDALLQHRIATYHDSASGDERTLAAELLSEFRSSLTDVELEALLDATK